MQLCIMYALMYQACNHVSCMQLCMKYAIMRQLRNVSCMQFMISVCTSLHTALNNSKHPKLFINLSIFETFPLKVNSQILQILQNLTFTKYWFDSGKKGRERGIRNRKKSKQKV